MKRKSRILCTLILCLSVILSCSFVSFADGESAVADNSTSIITAFDMPEEYITNYPYMNREVLQGYAQSNGLAYDFQMDYLSGLFDRVNDIQLRNGFSSLKAYTTFYTSAGTTIDVSGLPLCVTSSVNGNNWACYLRFSGSGNIAIVNNYFVSTESFTIYAYQSNNGDYSINSSQLFRFKVFDINTPDANGLYKVTFLGNNENDYYYFRNTQLIFSNLPIYLSSISGNSGFTASSTSDISDFTFLSDNINYNYLLYDEIISDPQAPEIPPSNDMWEESKNYLNFRMTSYFMWDNSSKMFYHNMNFNWNENMMLNPDYYYLNCYYYITYKDSSMPSVVTYQYSPIVRNLLDIAYSRHQNIGVVPSKYTLGLFPDEFYDTSENSWLSAYLGTIHRVVGTNTNLININDYWDRQATSIDEFGDYVFSGGRKLSYVLPIVGDTIEEFKIHCIVNVGRSADPLGVSGQQDFISGSYSATHDCLTAKTTVTSKDNENNLYPPEEGQAPSVIDSDNSGSSGNTTIGNNAQGGNANVTVNTADNPFKNWSPEAVESLKETWDTIKEELDAHKNNSFMALMVESYKIIPDQLWQVIILCGSVISIFAVVRFIRNR